MNKQILKQIKSFRFGDRVEVEWLDASEAAGRLKDAKIVTHVQSIGYFLLHKKGHIIIAKEVVNYGEAYHYNVIPVNMIEELTVDPTRGLDPRTKRVLRKFLRVKAPRLTKKDGWLYAKR